MRFLALGDSYTIGEGVPLAACWPVQLAGRLRQAGFPISDPEIVATTGWTTVELAAGIGRVPLRPPYAVVSLLIGVNNQYRGYPRAAYRVEFSALLEQAIGFAGGEPARVVVLSIPDWSVTPFASGRDTDAIRRQVTAFNRINRAESMSRGVHYIDVTDSSRRAIDQPDLLAADGLHPSGKMYAAWVEQILPLASRILAGTFGANG